MLLSVGACSLLEQEPLCAHPSCLGHLHFGATEAEVISGTWKDSAWQRSEFFGPVGRDLVFLRGYATVSPLAFEDGVLIGWVHSFRSDTWKSNGALRVLKGLHSGVSPQTVHKEMGYPDRVVRFQSAANEEFQIWSWKGMALSLGFSRLLEFDALDGTDKLPPNLTLRGYVEGFQEFRVVE